MRKFYLIIATLCFIFTVSATDYVVSGSWNQELNGLYIEAGTKDGYPYFVKSGDNQNREMGIAYQWGMWVIGSHYGNGYVMDYERCYDQGAPPLTGWSGGITIAPNGPNVKYIGANDFKEMISNNGSVAGEGIFIHNMFYGEGFAGEIGDEYISKGLMTISNLNEGLQVSITKISNDSLKLVLSGQATQHNLDSNFVINFTDNAFSGGGTLAGTGGTGSKTLSINFINALYVASSGADFTTISSAVEAAGSGDFIHISGETYTESINTNKELSFIGAGASKTIIQAHADYNTATNSIFTNYSSKMFFRDLTIKNGRLLYGNAYGGAIQADDLEMVNCVVRDNISDGNNSGGMCGGGAIRANDVKLTNCLIHNNKVVNSGNSYGGGIVCNSLIANNCIFSDNSITNMSTIAWQSAGGAVCVSSNVVNKIINCTFINNSAKIGGGIYIPNPLNGTEIKNSIFYNNVGTINGGDVYRENGEEILALNSIIQNYYSQSGNAFTNTSTIIQENPLLLALSDNGGEIPSIGLQTGSPAINAGIEDAEVQNKDIRGFYKSGKRDIGAFEFGGINQEYIESNESACSYFVFGQDSLRTSGTYSRTSGDTMYTINLSIKLPTSSSETISHCGSYTWPANGQIYTQSGTYTAVLQNKAGCDSTVTLDLTVKYPTTSTTTYTTGKPYLWNGITYESSGSYTFTTLNSVGCDSVATLILTINVFTTLKTTSCNTTLSAMTDYIYGQSVSGATAYRFRVTNTATNAVQVLERSSSVYSSPSVFSLAMLPSKNYATTYTVEIAVKKYNTWFTYGTACNVTSPSAPATSVNETQCDVVLPLINSRINAKKVICANRYRFEATQNGTTLTYTSTTSSFNLTQLAGGAKYATAYIIKVAYSTDNGVTFSDYGLACTITTPAAPLTKVISSQCGITLTSLSNGVYADRKYGATKYKFRIDNNEGSVVEYETVNYFFNFSILTGNKFGKTYTVNVAYSTDGGVNYTAYGVDCSITTPAAPLTKVKPSQCNSVLPTASTWILAVPITGANKYKFEVVGNSKTRYFATTAIGFRLTSLVGGITFGTEYTVRVAYSFDGGLNWSAYGDACKVTTPAPSREVAGPSTPSALSVYPNPFTSTFKIATIFEGLVNVRVIDLTGKLIEQFDVEASELVSKEIGQSYVPGMYQVTISQDEQIENFKIVKND